MFEGLGSRSRRRRRRTSIRPSRRRVGRGMSRRSFSNLGPILKIAGLVLAVAGLACLVIFVIVPLFGGEQPDDAADSTPTPVMTPTPTPEPTPIAKADMSDGVQELVIDYKSVNDPYMSADGTEMVFTSGNPLQTTPEVDTVVIYDMQAGTTTAVEGIEREYISLFEPKISENFIVYLDCKSQYGGAVKGYDRNTGESFVMREYVYGKPKVSLVGDYALWMQQTGPGTDKLYLYHLPTQESVTIEEFVGTTFSFCAAHMNLDKLVYVQPYGESNVLYTSSKSGDAEIVVMPLVDGGDGQTTQFLPGTFVYDPKVYDDYVAYLDGPLNDDCQLMVCEKTDGTYSEPELVAQDILNFDVGDGYLVYTKDDGIYIYYFSDGSSGQLSSNELQSILASASGKYVVWYDITDGLDASANVIKYIEVP